MSSYDTNVDRLLTTYRSIRRIGLVSPWSGGNLGNEAILSAMIANIRKRIVGAEILGITLSPQATRLRLGVSGFPVVGMSQRYYYVCNSGEPDTRGQQYVHVGGLKNLLKRVPALWSLLRGIRYSKPVVELAHVLSASRVARNLDLIIICGGGAIDDSWGGGWGHPWSLFKWGLLSRLNNVPLLFVSVGWSPLERLLSRIFVGTALRLAAYRSYRDHESRQGVKTLLDNPRDSVYPDLAFSHCFSLYESPDDSGSGSEGRLLVGLSPIAYCDPRVWPHSDTRRYTAYVNKMAEFVRWLLAEGYKVLFFATDTPDTRTIEDILSMLRDSGAPCSEIETLPGPAEQSAADLLKGICRADLIIASRLHGVILSHLNGIPVLALPCEPKVDAHMKRIGQMDYCFDIDTFTHTNLISAFRVLEGHRQKERTAIRSELLGFRQLLNQQYDKIFGPPHDPEDQ